MRAWCSRWRRGGSCRSRFSVSRGKCYLPEISRTPSRCNAATAVNESTGPPEEFKEEILRALSRLQESVEQNASDKLAEPSFLLVVLVISAVALFVVIDSNTGIVDEALELFEYDRDPRFIGGQGEGAKLEAWKSVRRLGRADIETTQLMLNDGEEERLTVLPVKEQLSLEQVVRRTAMEVDSRESQIIFLLLTWALLAEGTEAFFRTPDAPLQP